MKNLHLPRRVIVVLLALATGSAWAQSSTWTGPDGGLFGTPANWNIGVPGDTTGAVFNADGSYLVNFNANASSSNVVVETGTATFDLGGNTYSAGRYAGISVTNGATLIVTNGTLRPYALPTATAILTVDATSTVRINSGGTLNIGDNNGIITPTSPSWAVGSQLIVDGGIYLSVQPNYTAPGSVLVTNGGQATISYRPSQGGGTIVTGPGSLLTLNSDGYAGNPFVPNSLIIANGASFVGAGGIYDSVFTVRDGSTATVGYLYSDGNSYGDAMRYNVYDSTLTVSGSLANNRAISLNNFYGTGGLGGQMTLSNGTVNISAGKSIALLEDQDSANHPELRGVGTIQRSTVGSNFNINSTGLIMPGDFSATPAIGTLTLVNGDLFQTNSVTGSRPTPGLRLDFNPTVSGSADLIDITGGSVTITAGSNLFNNIVAGPLVLGRWDFIKADSITYTGSDNMAALVAALGLPSIPPDAEYYFGVVTRDGFDFLELSVVPEPTTFALLGLAGMLLLRRRQ